MNDTAVCGCIRASFVLVGETDPGWLKRCDDHRKQDLRSALESSEREGWTHFVLGGDGQALSVYEAMAAIAAGSAVDRRR